jgi:hypothetical protein
VISVTWFAYRPVTISRYAGGVLQQDVRGDSFVSRQSLVISVAVGALLLGLSACGGSDDKADPKATKTTASPTPTTPVQPQGASGVTYDVLNWEDYSEDPAVLAWKTANESIAASLNHGKLLPGTRESLSKDVLRDYLPSLREAWKQHWHVKPVGQARIESASTSASTSKLVVCMWGSSVGFYDKKNAYVGKPENYWRKQNVGLTLSDGRWVLTSFKFNGKCPGGAPA